MFLTSISRHVIFFYALAILNLAIVDVQLRLVSDRIMNAIKFPCETWSELIKSVRDMQSTNKSCDKPTSSLIDPDTEERTCRVLKPTVLHSKSCSAEENLGLVPLSDIFSRGMYKENVNRCTNYPSLEVQSENRENYHKVELVGGIIEEVWGERDPWNIYVSLRDPSHCRVAACVHTSCLATYPALRVVGTAILLSCPSILWVPNIEISENSPKSPVLPLLIITLRCLKKVIPLSKHLNNSNTGNTVASESYNFERNSTDTEAVEIYASDASHHPSVVHGHEKGEESDFEAYLSGLKYKEPSMSYSRANGLGALSSAFSPVYHRDIHVTGDTGYANLSISGYATEENHSLSTFLKSRSTLSPVKSFSNCSEIDKKNVSTPCSDVAQPATPWDEFL